jgi:hypothetical protein
MAELQKVRVLSPNGSEDWVMNTAHTITWEHKLAASQRFDIDLSVDGGSAWTSLARNVAGDPAGGRGTYDVTMPRYGSVAALIRVSPAGDVANGDVSDGGFLLGEATLRLLSPISYSVRSSGGSALFQATSNLGPGERYKIEISFNNGQNWQTLAESAPSPMTFSVPANTYSNRPPRADIRVTSLTVPTLRALGSLQIQY